MTIRHLFLWSVVDDADRDDVLSQLAGLPDRIPGLQNWSIGANTFESLASPQARHFDYALTCDFDSSEGLRAYQEHPAHQEVVERVMPFYASWTVADLEL